MDEVEIKFKKEELIGLYYVLGESEEYKKFIEINRVLANGKRINDFLVGIEKAIPELIKEK